MFIFIFDRHNDLPWQMYKNEHNVLANIDLNSDMRLRWNISHTDIPRLRQGQVGAQVKKAIICYTYRPTCKLCN